MVPPASHGVPRVPRYSGSRPVRRAFRVRGYHPLWPAFPCRSPKRSHPCVSPQPRWINPPVCPLPRSLATTSGISVDFSSSPYLDVSVQAVPHLRLFDSTQVDGVLLRRVSPFGDPRIDAYVPLPVAYRSLSRPSSAPDAKAFPLRSFQLDLVVAKSAHSVSGDSLRLSPKSSVRSLAPPLANEPASLGSVRVLEGQGHDLESSSQRASLVLNCSERIMQASRDLWLIVLPIWFHNFCFWILCCLLHISGMFLRCSVFKVRL